MGFFKSIINQKASAIYTVDTRVKVYNKLKAQFPMLEPHQLLMRTYINYAQGRDKAFPNVSTETVFNETFLFAAMPEPSNIKALALYLMYRTKDIDGGIIYAYPNYEAEYKRLVGDNAEMYGKDSQRLMKDFTALNPATAEDLTKHNFKRF
jgi:hypothetical protein